MATNSKLLRGVVPPVCTPFTADYEVDEKSLRRLVNHLIDGGVHGLFVLGSTSEVAYLTDKRRADVIRIAIDETAGRVPVVAGAIDMTTLRVNEHVRAAVAAGIDGIVITAPFYARTHPEEIALHFRLVKEECGDVPLYAYDIPVAVNGVKLETATVLKLAKEGVIQGLKDSSDLDAGIRAVVLGAQEHIGQHRHRLAPFDDTDHVLDRTEDLFTGGCEFHSFRSGLYPDVIAIVEPVDMGRTPEKPLNSVPWTLYAAGTSRARPVHSL